MELYPRIVDEFSKLPHVKEWESLQSLFRRVASGEPGHWLLPLRVCEAVGGDLDSALPAVLAVACSHIGIVLVDDMLDADPRGEHVQAGESAVANMALALQSAALAAAARCDMRSDEKVTVLECVNEIFLATTLGQYWDVNSMVADEASYWKLVKTKSSPFFGAAFQLGAFAGGASASDAGQLKEVGAIYGEMIQIHDDLNDVLEHPANPDWNEARSPLPILFARFVDHPFRARFEELRPYAGSNSGALKEAQEILIQCGAVSYCFYQLLGRYEKARNILSSLPLARRERLETVLDGIVSPIRRLLEEADPAPAMGHPAGRA